MADDIAAAWADFFSQDDWPAVFDTDRDCFVVRFQGSQSDWTCAAYAIEEDHQALFYSLAPVRSDEAHMLATAEFITRANTGLILGNFELDFEDGSIRYKTSIDVEGDELTPALLRHVVHANVQAMDQYLPGIMAVVTGAVAPIDAIALAERESDEDPDGE